MSLKSGKLSIEEERFIIDNVHKMSLDDIAEKINRRVGTVQRFVSKRKLVAELTPEEKEDEKRLIAHLHEKPFWPAVAEVHTQQEIKFFEGNWIAMVREFKEELTGAEEFHLRDWLTTQIQVNRCLAAQKSAVDTINHLENLIKSDQAALKEIGDPSDEDFKIMSARIAQSTTELSILKNTLPDFANQYVKLTAQSKQFSDLLKATRDKPRDMKVNEDTWWGYVEKLQDEKFRRSESRKAELLKLSMLKARERMSEYHEFCDGTLDKILLNNDTVEVEKEDK